MVSIHLPLDAALSLGRDSHGSFMLAAAARLQMTMGDWESQFLLDVRDPSAIASVVQGMPTAGIADALLKHNLLSASEFEEIADQLSQEPNWHTAVNSMMMSQLSSPLLSEKKINSLMSSIHKKNPARLALMANPNCPKNLIQVDSLSKKQRQNYAESISRHGDLTSEKTQEALKDLFTVQPNQSWQQEQEHRIHSDKCCWFLAERADLPPDIAINIDAIAEPSLYAKLAKSPVHRALVKSGRLDGSNNRVPGRSWSLRLSPEATTEKLMGMATSQDAEFSVLSTIVAHPNAHSGDVMKLIERVSRKEAETLVGKLIEQQSPAAEMAMVAIHRKFPDSTFSKDVGDLETVSPEVLEAALKETCESKTWDAATKTMCNPNFPWKKHNGLTQELKKSLPPYQLTAIMAARAQSGATTPEDFEHALTDEVAAAAILFAHNLSSRRLGKLSETYRDLAPLAAIHPNGFTVRTNDMTKDTREFVESVRCHPLVGHSNTPSASLKPEVLSI